MNITAKSIGIAMLSSAFALSAAGQALPDSPAPLPAQSQPPGFVTPVAASTPTPTAVQQLLAFKDSDIKFNLRDLMEILRDRRHEGWVLAAYPDPKTGHPLIGAGFSLDLPERAHPQPDQLNPHAFIEPSSAELWQAAGLDSDRLQSILDQFDNRAASWSKRTFRRKINSLAPQISDDDANQLLRVAAIQAAINAKGYCRAFDSLTASQQMALSQLVYQMGVNLQHFSQFLDLMNDYSSKVEAAAAVPSHSDLATDPEYWKTVQQSLVQSQWARLYRIRAVAVIAMLDPHYADEPGAAERRVGAMLRPAVVHRRLRHSSAARQIASNAGPSGVPHSRLRTTRSKAHHRGKQNV
jgi:hypothetical protein